MKVQTKIIILLSLVLFCMISIYVWQTSRINYKRMYAMLERGAVQMEYAFKTEQDAAEVHMLQLATLVAGDPKVRQLFLLGKTAVELEGGGAGGEWTAQVRESLHQHLKERHAVLAAQFGFRQLHFHFGPGSLSFLRVHRPEKFGDRMDTVRYTIVDANANQEPVMGFETGRVVSGIRGVIPVYGQDSATDERIHVGALEAGTSFDNMLGMFQQHRPWLDAAVLLSREHLQANIWPDFLQELEAEKKIVGGFRVEATTASLIEEFLTNDRFVESFMSPGFHLVKDNGLYYGVKTFPLRDYLGESDPSRPDAGLVILWRNVSEQLNSYYRDLRLLIIQGVMLFISLAIILFFGVRFATRRLQRELENTQKTAAVKDQAVQAVGTLNATNEAPQLQIHRALQAQIDDLVTATTAPLGLFICAGKNEGEFQILAVSDMVWSAMSGQKMFEMARQQMTQQGYFTCQLGDNQLVRAMHTKTSVILNDQECRQQQVGRFLPEGHPALNNLLMVPVQMGENQLASLVLANREGGFGAKDEVLAKGHASAAALIMHADLREVARRSAEESSRLKTEFLNTMSHELRTPLNAIMGFGQILGKSSLDQRQQDYIDKINLSSKTLLNLIEEVMLIAQLESDSAAELSPERFHLGLLFSQLVNHFYERAKNQGVTLKIDSATGAPSSVKGYPLALERILRQLIGNAIKYSDQGDVVLSLAQLAREDQQAVLEFAVSDQGTGIPEEIQEKIFEPFIQGDSSNTRRYGGTGLGLAIAQKLCQQLGGHIRVESEPGVGSRFSFQLEFQLAEEIAADGNLQAQAIADVEPVAPETGTEEQLGLLLEQLQQPLAALQAKPCQGIARQLGSQRWPKALQAKIDQLINFIGKYRFAEAQETLADLEEMTKQKFDQD